MAVLSKPKSNEMENGVAAPAVLDKKAKANRIEIEYTQIEADPEEIRLRIKQAYAVVFEEVIKRRLAILESNKEKNGLNAEGAA